MSPLTTLADPVAQQLLDSGLPARLGYIGVDGFPRVVPVGFHWDYREVIIWTATNAPKVAAIQANPKVAFTIDGAFEPPQILMVCGIATVTIVQGIPDEFIATTKKLVAPNEWPAVESKLRATYKNVARISFPPDTVKIFDFNPTTTFSE
jgi:hypothetical protein